MSVLLHLVHKVAPEDAAVANFKQVFELLKCCCRLSHAGSSNNLSPSTSTSLSRFSSSDFTISPGAQLTSPIASGLSINSSTTNQGFPYFGSPSQHITSSARQLGSPNHHVGNHTQQLGMAAYPATAVDAGRGYRGANPMAGQQWLPQNPSLASHLGQMRNEKQKSRPTPLDFTDGLWGFDEFPPVPGESLLHECAYLSTDILTHECCKCFSTRHRADCTVCTTTALQLLVWHVGSVVLYCISSLS